MDKNMLNMPVLRQHGNKLVMKEVLCHHCIAAGKIEEAYALYEKYKDEVESTAENIISVRDAILQRSLPISRLLSCEAAHKGIYQEKYGADWEKYYTKFSGHLYGLAVDFKFLSLRELQRLFTELPRLTGIERYGFEPKTSGLFHFDLWGIELYQQKYLYPAGKAIDKRAMWYY